MLGVIMIALSYSYYEASLWNADQAFFLSNVSKYSIETSNEELKHGQQYVSDVLLFNRYADALIKNDQNLSNFYYHRFSPEMKVSVDAWIQTDPLKNSNAPASPFVMEDYNRTHILLAQQFEAKTFSELVKAQEANKNSSSYVFLSVIYSSALFLDGVISRISDKKVSQILLYMTIAITIIATTILIGLPLPSR
jgi:hypothetical protein